MIRPDPRIRLIEQIGPLLVYLVDGPMVRAHWDIDFTMGANTEARDWMPKDPPEVWIDSQNEVELKPTLVHELHEYNDMLEFGMEYEPAHDIASAVERGIRLKPETLDRIMNRERERTIRLLTKMASDGLARAAGVIFKDPDSFALFLRSGEKPWELPGGKVERGEDEEEAARRECLEEVGREPGPLLPYSRTVLPDGQGEFCTYICRVAEAFMPKLSSEHDRAIWVSIANPPRPLHPGVEDALLRGSAQDEKRSDKFTWGEGDLEEVGSTEDEFVESKHPRDDDGKFSETAGGGGGGGGADPEWLPHNWKGHKGIKGLPLAELAHSKGLKPVGDYGTFATPDKKIKADISGSGQWQAQRKGEPVQEGEGLESLKNFLDGKDDPSIRRSRKKTIKLPTAEETAERRATGERITREIDQQKRTMRVMNEVSPQPSEAESKALYYYSQKGYSDLNPALRSDPTAMNEDIRLLDEYLGRSEIPEDITLYRGIKGEYAAQLLSSFKEGARFVDHGYMSTSPNSVSAGDFARGDKDAMVVVMSVKKGSRGASIDKWSGHGTGTASAGSASASEEEVLLPRGTSFVVRSYDPASRRLHVEVERSLAQDEAEPSDKFGYGAGELQIISVGERPAPDPSDEDDGIEEIAPEDAPPVTETVHVYEQP